MATAKKPPAAPAPAAPRTFSEHKPEHNVFQRILGVMTDVGYVQKAGQAPSAAGGYKFVKHDDVTGSLRPSLIHHGLVVMHSVAEHERSDVKTRDGKTSIFTQVKLVTRFINADDPKDTHEVETWGYGIDSQDKSIGKAITYAAKYAKLGAFQLETGDDPEADDGKFTYDGKANGTTSPPPPPQDLGSTTQAPKPAAPRSSSKVDVARSFIANQFPDPESQIVAGKIFMGIRFPGQALKDLAEPELQTMMAWAAGQKYLADTIANPNNDVTLATALFAANMVDDEITESHPELLARLDADQIGEVLKSMGVVNG